MIPSLFPAYDYASESLVDGGAVLASPFCAKAIRTRPECKAHYNALRNRPEGFHQCPFGFTTRTFYFAGQLTAITGVIAHPRFGTPKERELAKKYPDTRVSRDSIDRARMVFSDIDTLSADTIQKAAHIFPQSFHELRKLNGAVLQHAEKEIRDNGATSGLQTILSAAELMRNNFDILEALSNIDAMKAVPLDATINVYDLVYKTRCVYLERLNLRKMQINLTGVRAIVRGSRKSFPIVPAVLLENAIKYGRPQTSIRAHVSAIDSNSKMQLLVENETLHPIDPSKCFDRGTRFAGQSVEGGGFGLYLAKEIVSAHRGKIWCEKNGATVRMFVELPLEKIIV